MAAQPKISRLVPVTALLLLALFASPVGAESGTEPSLPQMPKQPPDRNNSRSLISPGRHRLRSLWPRTGDTVASIRRIAETLKSHGYSVDLINVDASEDEAARRVVRRFLEIGRMLRARFLKESREHAHNSYEGLINASRFHRALAVASPPRRRSRIWAPRRRWSGNTMRRL